MTRVISNKFKKVCSNQECKKHVETGDGYSVYENGAWNTFHKTCLPHVYEQFIQAAPAPQPKIMNKYGEIFFPFDRNVVDLVKTIPGRRFDANKRCWVIPLVPESLNKAFEICNIAQISVADELQDYAKTMPAYEFITQKEFEIHNIDKLFSYQLEGSKFLASKDRALLGDEMGTGKTVQSLSALPSNSKVLIIAPACVKYNWAKEIQRWRSDFSSKVVIGKDNFTFPNDNEVIICNREVLPDFFLTHKTGETYSKLDPEIIAKLKTTIVLVDEAHQFKGTKTSAHRKLANIARHAKKVWALTGTPLLNRPMDLWGVLKACNMENAVFGGNGKSAFDFFTECFSAVRGRHGYVWGKPTHIVPALLSKVHICRKRKDVLSQLPDKIYTDLEVELGSSKLDSKIKKKLDDLNREFSEFFTNQKLPPFHAFSAIRADIARSRIEPMLEYVNDCEEQEIPLLVFSAHLDPLDALRGRPGWGIIDGNTKAEDRLKIVDLFQSGVLNGIGCTIKAAGVGLNITRAWKALFVDMDWVPANNWQAESRILRIGQKSDKVEIVRFFSNHPVDRRLMELLTSKTELIKETFDMNRTVLEEQNSGQV